ncbi:MAG: phage terminase large subunit [Firmicutes bacterium]|nr:phage terminase large subunit [Bacillota bacterium]
MNKLKIGDKIDIQLPQEKKKTTIESTFFDILSALKSPKLNQSQKLTWCSTVFEILEEWFKENDLKSVRVAKERLIPILYNLVEKGSIENKSLFFDFYKRAYCFCARRDFECFVDFIEWKSPKKVLANRREVLKPYVDALNRIAFDDKLQYIVVSYPPSMGKSYLATLFTAWGYGLSIDNSVLRISSSAELVTGFSRAIKGYLCSPEFSEIFPLFKLYNGKPFSTEKESDWKIKNSNVPKSNHIARSREGTTIGERASFAIIFDDLTKGIEEVNSEKVQRENYDKWLTEWWNRRDGQRCKYIFVGTQWSPEDILNKIIEDRNKVSLLQETDNPYVMESEDHSTIVIRVPMLDDNHKTTCPEVYPQEIAEQIEQNTDPFLFSCVYQQQPIAPTGREFAWECIRTYIELPDNLTINSMATLDTARKGKDNVSMPIFKNDNNGNHYLVDAIYKQKPMDDLYDEIIEKIIEHKITTLVIENNIDTSLKRLLEDRLHEKGIFYCDIKEKYNTVKKEERIKNNRGIVQKQIVFPDKSIVRPNTDIGRMMDNITKYSFDKPNLHDDGVDSVCMYGGEIIMGKSVLPKAKAFKRIF